MLAAAAATLIAVAAAGCGSSAQPLSRKQLISKADAVCGKLHTKVKAIGPVKTPQDLARATRKLAGFEQQQIEAMKKLVPPKQLASDWKQMIEGVQELSESVATVSTDLQAKKKKTAQAALKQVGEIERKITAIAKRDGFNACTEVT